jgi:methylase of polypeptide subunit release factors
VLHTLRAAGYHFITPTPATHGRVLARKSQAEDLRDIFGWSLPFAADQMPSHFLELLQRADLIRERDGLLVSTLRVSTLDNFLFLHSAYPTDAENAVFFGPDSYRYAAFLQTAMPKLAPRKHIVDIGTGSGVGAMVAATLAPDADFTVTDINPQALALAKANLLHATTNFQIKRGEHWRFRCCDGLSGVDGEIDTIIANPPYLNDPTHRAYRDGGGPHGAALSLAWAEEAAGRLKSGGAFLLYTGSAIVRGADLLRSLLADILFDFDVSYREIDPDVFGEELAREDYADVERIAVVGVVAVKR